ncbi:hypothetical protein FHS15_000336 [Paenibacillus castaneae]|uniref:DUF2332 domain-containing protein n=1 Tax=Paenibacillus castaneae TaxID=474957 RepID=UPI000C9CFBAC|nr:DUF2332 domain-containing protein [Paenibacillus castaneae]NIK75238.1 hypothetical protein [Paenibacillus castaneae]
MGNEEIAKRFENFASKECRGSSEWYEYISIHIAGDVEILEIASHARAGQPIPNLFFGAVHYLLLSGTDHKLGQYYASMVQTPKKLDQQAYPHFKDFCLSNRSRIVSLLQNKLVQTNEVARCAYLYPSFCFIYKKALKPLALIEIGTSAGLQLLWDKYSYTYHSDDLYGDRHSKVIISSEIRGDKMPFLQKEIPPVALRYGIDLHINDVNNKEDYVWLKSLIWPEHEDRRSLFEQAANCMKENHVQLIEENGVTFLPHIIEQIPHETAICIFHTHVANQFPEQAKYELLHYINKIGKTRDVFHLYNNMWDSKLHLDYFISGREYNETVAETEGHGRWFQWELKE